MYMYIYIYDTNMKKDMNINTMWYDMVAYHVICYGMI